MSALKTLVMMQLKEKLNLKGKKFKTKKTLFAIIFYLIKFALITGVAYLALYVCKYLQLFSLIGYIPSSVIGIVFSVMLLVSIISATASLTKSLYYSYDNPVLLTLPCRATQVYLSKIIVFYIFELIRNMSFIVPLFIGYGMINNLSFIYYPWMLLCFIFISLIPVLIGALLSIPSMWFYNFFRQYKRLQIVSLLIIILLVTIGVVKAIKIIPSNIDLIGTWGTTFWLIQDVLTNFTVKFNFLYRLVTMIVGVRSALINRIFIPSTFITFIFMLLTIIVLFFLGLVTAKPLFYKMASKPFEYRKQVTKYKTNKKNNKIVSILKNEILLTIRDPKRLFTNVGLLIALPVLILFLNKLFGAMNTRMLGNDMAIAFNVLIILLISLTSNYYASSIFSKDGRSSYLIKVQPSRYQPLLFAKLAFNTTFMFIAHIITYFVLINNTSIGKINSLLIIIACFCIYLAHLFFSAELDIMNPQIELYASVGNNDDNPNESKSTIIAFLTAFITFGVLLFLLIENNGVVTYVKVLIVAMIVMLFRLYLLISKIKLYYKEK